MAKDNLTKQANITASVRELDFVSRFGSNFQALLDILGISRAIKKTPGTKLVAYKGEVALQAGNVGEGEDIPYSLATVEEVELGDVSLEKYAKAVSIEAVNKYGAEIAVTKTDDAFLAKLQKVVTDKFYTFLQSGTLTHIASTFQMALAMAMANVLDMWKAMDKDITTVVGFVNIKDFYSYLGSADITIQTAFGLTYVENFLGYPIIFLCDDARVPRGKVLATPVENIVAYYVDPSDSDFAQLGLEYTVDGVTPFIGFHVQGNYGTAVGENYALMGIYLFAEYLNGISVVTVEASGSLESITVASAAGTASGDSAVTVTYTLGQGEAFYYKDAVAAATPTYLDEVDLSSWTKYAFTSGTAANIEDLTSGNVLTVIAVNGSGQAVASGNATIVVKS